MSANNGVRRPRPSRIEWEALRTQITDLYLNQGSTLEEVRSILRQENGFDASIKMYKSMLAKWNIRKNLNSTTMARALQQLELESPDELENRVGDRAIQVDGGETVMLSQIKRYRRRTTNHRVYHIEEKQSLATTSSGEIEDMIKRASQEDGRSSPFNKEVRNGPKGKATRARSAGARAGTEELSMRRTRSSTYHRNLSSRFWAAGTDQNQSDSHTALALQAHPQDEEVGCFTCPFNPYTNLALDSLDHSGPPSRTCNDVFDSMEEFRRHIQHEHLDVRNPVATLRPSEHDTVPVEEWAQEQEMDDAPHVGSSMFPDHAVLMDAEWEDLSGNLLGQFLSQYQACDPDIPLQTTPSTPVVETAPSRTFSPEETNVPQSLIIPIFRSVPQASQDATDTQRNRHRSRLRSSNQQQKAGKSLLSKGDDSMG